jgi:hypothetical protein
MHLLGRRHDRNGLRERLGCSGSLSSNFGSVRSGFLPGKFMTAKKLTLGVIYRLLTTTAGLRLPPLNLVRPLRHGQALLRLLPPRRSRIGIQRHPRFRLNANAWSGWTGRMAVDLYHRRHPDRLHRNHGLLPPRALPRRQPGESLEFPQQTRGGFHYCSRQC